MVEIKSRVWLRWLFRWRGFKQTSIIDTTQILNNFEYISRTVDINSQNKRHFTYITQFYNTLFSHSCSSCKLFIKPCRKRWYTVKVTKHSTKLDLICRFFNFFYVWIKSLVMFRMMSYCFCDVPPKKSTQLLTTRLLSGCVSVCVDEHILGTSTVFLKWNRITGDSRVGQDNRRSQIALQSKFKSSYAWRMSPKHCFFFKFSFYKS